MFGSTDVRLMIAPAQVELVVVEVLEVEVMEVMTLEVLELEVLVEVIC
jgi:hypothetical protein